MLLAVAVKALAVLAVIFLLSTADGQTIFPPPTSSASPTTVNPSSALPNFTTAGRINVVLAVSVTGQYSDRGVANQQSLALWLPLANNRGGIFINNTQYYFSYTWIDDASAQGYVYDIYTRFAQSTTPVYNIFLAPSGSPNTVTAVNTVKTYSKPIMGISATADSIYTSTYHDVYGQEGIASNRLNNAFTLLSQLDPPLQSAALFIRYDSTANATLTTLIPWLQSRNMSIIQATFSFPADQTSVGIGHMYNLLNTTLYDQPTPDIIILVASGTTDFLAIVPAFNQLQLSPKICLYTTSYPDMPGTAFETAGSGWLTTAYWDAAKNFDSTLPGTIFQSSQDYYNQFEAAYGTLPNVYNMQLSNALELMMAALTAAPNVSTTSYRTGMRSLNGSTIASPFQLHPTYQYNNRAIYYVYQLRGGENIWIENANDFEYPVIWPWIEVVPGDAIPVSQTINMIPLATLLAVAGSWVALILVESVVLMRKQRSPLFYVWLGLMSVSLGVAGSWTSIVVQYSALNIECTNCFADMSISYSISILFIVFLPAVLITYLGLLIIATGMTNSQVKPVEQHQNDGSQLSHTTNSSNTLTNTSSLLNKEKKKKITALSLYTDFVVLVDNVLKQLNIRLFIGTAFITLAFVLTRQILIYSLVTNAEFKVETWAAIISSLVVWILLTPAMSIYFYGASYRLLGVALVTAALIVDYQFHYQTMSVTYAPNQVSDMLSRPVLYQTQIGSSIVLLIAAVIGAFSGVMFIGLQFNKMKISHHSLATALLRQKQKLTQSDKDRRSLIKQKESAAALINELNRIIDAINVSRPYSLADKPPITHELIWALNSSSPLSALYGSATVCQQEMAGDKDKALLLGDTNATNTTQFDVNINASASDAETSILNHLRTMPVTEVNYHNIRKNSTIMSYQPSLNAILSHPLTLEIFKDEVERTHSVENVLFLAEIEKFYKINNKNLRNEISLQLYNEYIKVGSSQQININSTLRQALTDRVLHNHGGSSHATDLYELCAKEIRSLLLTNQWKTFITGPAYIRCAIILQRNIDITRAIRALEDAAGVTNNNEENNKDGNEDNDLSIFAQPTSSHGNDDARDDNVTNNNNNNITSPLHIVDEVQHQIIDSAAATQDELIAPLNQPNDQTQLIEP